MTNRISPFRRTTAAALVALTVFGQTALAAPPPVATSQAAPPVGTPTDMRRLPNVAAGSAATATPAAAAPGRVGANAPPQPGRQPAAVASPVVEQRTRHATEMAGRGAIYAAETEFLQTLKLISQLWDEREQGSQHSQALAVALTAFAEADHFNAALNNPVATTNVRALIDAHQTPVLKNYQGSEIPALFALQQYYEFAESQLTVAMGREPGASEALFGLARVYLIQATEGDEAAVVAKAIALFQVALAADPSNYRAANELGVLFARCGRTEQARQVLEHGVSISDEPEIWKNLAVIYERLGDTERSRQATARSEQTRESRSSAANPLVSQVKWVDPNTFSQSPGHGFVSDPAPPANATANADAARPAVTNKKKPTDWNQVKSFFRIGKSPEPNARLAADQMSMDGFRPANTPQETNNTRPSYDNPTR
ncbi:MAG: tetratricopeptide repeat protein [Pirellulales bacterium]